MRIALIIAARDLASRLRDRSALIVGFLAPVALALIISFAFQGGSEAFRADVGVVDLDDSELSRLFVGDVLGSADLREVFATQTFDRRDAVEAAIAQGALDAAFVLHPGLDRITVLRAPGSAIAGEIATTVAQSFAAQIEGVGQAIGLSVMVSVLGADAFGEDGFVPGGFDGTVDAAAFAEVDVAALAEEVANAPLPIALEDASTGPSALSSASYFGPGMAMLFVFFLLASGPRSLLAERRLGTLARLRAAPVRTGSIIAGKGLAVALLGLVSMCVVWGVTSAVFGATWGDPLAVVALLLAFVAAALAISTLVSVYARTDAQADGFVSIVAFVLAMLGGNFLYLGDLPTVLERIALFTPNGWALRGFTTLTSDGGGIATVLGPIAAILAFALVAFALSVPGVRHWTAS